MGLVQQGANLDLSDLVILKWIAELSGRVSAKKKLIEEKTFVWVKYDTLLEDIPFIGIKKRALQTRLENLVGIGLLYHFHDTEKGSFSYYALTENYEKIIYDSEGSAKFCIGGMQENAEQRPTTIKPNISIEEVLADKREKFRACCEKYVPTYGRKMVEDFCNYWCEANGSKLKCEIAKQKTGCFEIGRRIANWASKPYNNNNWGYTPAPAPMPQKPKKTKWEEMGLTEEEYNKFIKG